MSPPYKHHRRGVRCAPHLGQSFLGLPRVALLGVWGGPTRAIAAPRGSSAPRKAAQFSAGAERGQPPAGTRSPPHMCLNPRTDRPTGGHAAFGPQGVPSQGINVN